MLWWHLQDKTTTELKYAGYHEIHINGSSLYSHLTLVQPNILCFKSVFSCLNWPSSGLGGKACFLYQQKDYTGSSWLAKLFSLEMFYPYHFHPSHLLDGGNLNSKAKPSARSEHGRLKQISQPTRESCSKGHSIFWYRYTSFDAGEPKKLW